MSRRKIPIVTNEIYHVFNRSIAKQPIFQTKSEYNRFLKIIDFYRFDERLLRFSHFDRLERKLRDKFLDSLYGSPERIQIYSFCIMPNHFHFLAKQIKDYGLTNFVSQIQNSYAKYINLKTSRVGGLFQSPFKAIRIESEEQLLHTSRYIHLNPLTSYILEKPHELESYKYASFIDYISKESRKFVNVDWVRNSFKSIKNFRDFTFDQVDYQRNLEKIKHLTFED